MGIPPGRWNSGTARLPPIQRPSLRPICDPSDAAIRNNHCGIAGGVAAGAVDQRRTPDDQFAERTHAFACRACRSALRHPVHFGLGGLAADGNNRALDGRHIGLVAIESLAVGLGLGLILGADITAVDRQRAVGVEADEGAGDRDIGRIVADRAVIESVQSLFDLTETLIDCVRQLVSLGIFRFDPVIFLAQRFAGRAFLVGQIDRGAGEFTQVMVVAIGEAHRDLDPLPAFFGLERFRIGRTGSLALLDETGKWLVAPAGVRRPEAIGDALRIRRLRALRRHVPHELVVRIPAVSRRAFRRIGVEREQPFALARVVTVEGDQHTLHTAALEGGQGLGTHHVLGDVELDAAGGVLQGGEAGLAHDTLEHHAAGHADGHTLRFQGLGFGAIVLVVQSGGTLLGLEVVGEHRLPRLFGRGAQLGQFLATLRDQLVVVGRGQGDVGAHGRKGLRWWREPPGVWVFRRQALHFRLWCHRGGRPGA